MKVLIQIATLSSVLIIPAFALAEPANVGEPFGSGVVAPAAHDKSLKSGVQNEVPGTDGLSDGVLGAPSHLDDRVHNNLGDDEPGVGNIRGHGKKDAPGQN
jgi:hypothetical protein